MIALLPMIGDMAITGAPHPAIALPRAFLPPFNEGTLTVNVVLNPGSSLAESNQIGAQAENILLAVPEVTEVGRRTGHALTHN